MATPVGTIVGLNLVLISENKVLDKVNGTVLDLSRVKDRLFERVSISSIKKEAEVVTGIDATLIDLQIANSRGKVDPISGFLVEVFLSGSDGKLTKVYKEDIVDPINDEIIRGGYGEFLRLETDTE